jgi:hypothetical protein
MAGFREVAVLFLATSALLGVRAQTLPDITPPDPLNGNAGSDSQVDLYPHVATDGAGVWITSWYSGENLGGQIGLDFDILFARSTDYGVTWTAPQALNTNASTDLLSDVSPHLATDGAGHWVAVWESLDSLGGSIGTDRDVVVARSSDNGLTWTAPQPLNTNAAFDVGQDWSPFVVTDRSGQWLAVWSSDDGLDGSQRADYEVFFARSSDNGATWTAPAVLNANGATDIGGDHVPRAATDGAGNWVVVWHSTDPLVGSSGADRDILVSRSIDGGATWTVPVPLNTNAATDSGADAYCQIATNRSGTWIAIWQSTDSLGGTIGGEADILFARTHDAGVTWTDPAPVNTNADVDSGHDGGPKLATDAAGDWIALWNSENSLGGVIGEDGDVLLAHSSDDGRSWTDPRPLNSNAATDAGDDGAPHLAADPAGNWIGVWQSDENLGGAMGPDFDIFVARAGFCKIRVENAAATTIHFSPTFPPVTFDVVKGALTELRGDGGFDRASCLGTYSSNPATDMSPAPPPHEGHYYLACGLSSCVAQGYGAGSTDPDPRRDLEATGPCP